MRSGRTRAARKKQCFALRKKVAKSNAVALRKKVGVGVAEANAWLRPRVKSL